MISKAAPRSIFNTVYVGTNSDVLFQTKIIDEIYNPGIIGKENTKRD